MGGEKPLNINKDDFPTLDSLSSTKIDSLTPQQRAAIEYSEKVGKEIQEKYPQVAMEYINGATISELLAKYNIQDKYGRFAMLNALRGTKKYPGLILDPEVLRSIGISHKKTNARKVGTWARDNKVGMFGMDDERKKEIAKLSGMALQKAGKGIHAQSIEERKKLGKLSALQRGYVPFSEKELSLINTLLSSPEYQYRDKVAVKKIAEALNNQIHNGEAFRSSHAVARILNQNQKLHSRNLSDDTFREGAD